MQCTSITTERRIIADAIQRHDDAIFVEFRAQLRMMQFKTTLELMKAAATSKQNDLLFHFSTYHRDSFQPQSTCAIGKPCNDFDESDQRDTGQTLAAMALCGFIKFVNWTRREALN